MNEADLSLVLKYINNPHGLMHIRWYFERFISDLYCNSGMRDDVLGIGVDIISIARIKSIVENSGKVFLDEVYTEWEQQRAKLHPEPIAYLAMTFAAKEAIFKCFSIGWETGVKFTEIEIADGKSGEPLPVLKGRFAELASERGAKKILLSLSYDTEYAVGTANLVGSKE